MGWSLAIRTHVPTPEPVGTCPSLLPVSRLTPADPEQIARARGRPRTLSADSHCKRILRNAFGRNRRRQIDEHDLSDIPPYEVNVSVQDIAIAHACSQFERIGNLTAPGVCPPHALVRDCGRDVDLHAAWAGVAVPGVLDLDPETDNGFVAVRDVCVSTGSKSMLTTSMFIRS
jgi:hypothetical protein